MNLLKTIKNIERISVFLDFVLYKSNENKLYSFEKNDVILLDNVYDYHVFKEIIFYQENNLESLYVYNFPDKYKKNINGIFSLKGAFYIDENNFYILGKKDDKKVIYIYDSKTYSLKSIVNSEYFPRYSCNDLYLCEKKDTIYCLNDCLSDVLWSYTLPEGYKIFGSPKVIDDVLYILSYTSYFQKSYRVGLDLTTGEKLWERHGGIDSNNISVHANTFNPTDKLYFGLYKTLQVFNPKTGELFLDEKIDTVIEENLDPYVKSIYDDKLWFVSGKYETCKFGYVNLKTHKIELLQDFPQENDEQFDEPVFNEGKLYLRGKHYNNLYIFE